MILPYKLEQTGTRSGDIVRLYIRYERPLWLSARAVRVRGKCFITGTGWRVMDMHMGRKGSGGNTERVLSLERAGVVFSGQSRME